VTFNSAAPRTFDIVVGADGVHSNTRRLVFGEEKQFSSFLDCYIAIFTTENMLDISHRHLAFNLPGKMVSMYSARKAEEAKAVFFFKSPQLSYDFRDTKAQKRLLAQAFAGEKAWIVPQLLRVMGGASDFYFDSLSQIHLPNWSTGNVVLVGDAAYGASPASGQGSSMAIVGAYILAQQLSRATDYVDAFAAYQQKMTAYVEACQALAPVTIEDMIIDSGLKFKMFSLMLRFPKMMQRMMKGGAASFNAKVAKAANSITLD